MAKWKFEEAMQRLQAIDEKMESGEETLDSSMKLYEEGAKLSAQCYQMLDKAEQKITELAKIPDRGEESDEANL